MAMIVTYTPRCRKGNFLPFKFKNAFQIYFYTHHRPKNKLTIFRSVNQSTWCKFQLASRCFITLVSCLVCDFRLMGASAVSSLIPASNSTAALLEAMDGRKFPEIGVIVGLILGRWITPRGGKLIYTYRQKMPKGNKILTY